MSVSPIRLADRVAPLPRAVDGSDQPVLVPMPILDRVRQALLDGETHYTSRPGLPALRRHVAAALGRLGGATFDADSGVVITSGEREALFVTLLALRSRRGPVAVDSPTPYDPLFRLLGWSPAIVNEEFPAAARVLYRDLRLLHSRHWSLLRLLPDDSVDVLNIATAIGGDDALPPMLPERTLLIGDCGGLEGQAAFGTGFIAGPPVLMAAVRTWKQAFSICTAAPSQRAALTAFEMKERTA